MIKLQQPNASFKEIAVKSLGYGFVAGMVSGMVKIGWENLFPPRTIERNKINPPQRMAEQLGFPRDLIHSYIYFSKDQKVHWFTLFLHFSFSIAFSTTYVFASQYFPKIGLWEGSAYGMALWFGWHIVLMPATKTIPVPWKQPFDEHFSEFFGHMVWGWTIASTVYYLIAKDKQGKLTQV